MAYSVTDMTEEFAKDISGWKYPAPYEAYSMDDNEDEIDELRNGLHYAVLDGDKLVGFIAIGFSAQPGRFGNIPKKARSIFEDESYTDIALGLRPSLCCRGLGKNMLDACLSLTEELFDDDRMRLTVAEDNERAIRLYTKYGFTKKLSYRLRSGKTMLIFTYN